MLRLDLDQRRLRLAQRASARAQRSRNRQPVGQSSGLGTMPGMAASAIFPPRRPAAEFNSPTV